MWRKARSSRQFFLMPLRLFFPSLQVENSILLENILQRTVRIKELEIIVKKVPLPLVYSSPKPKPSP